MISKMIRLCKKDKVCRIYTDSEYRARYLSDDNCYLILPEDVEFKSRDALAFAGLEADADDIKYGDLDFKKGAGIVSRFFDDAGYEKIDRFSPVIKLDGFEYAMFDTKKGMLFVKELYIHLFRDIGYREYYLSEISGQIAVLVVHNNTVVGAMHPEKMDTFFLKELFSFMHGSVCKANNNHFCDAGFHQEKLEV